MIEIIKHRRKHRRRIFFNVVKHKGTMIWESMTLMSLGYFFKNYINFFIWYLQDIKNGKKLFSSFSLVASRVDLTKHLSPAHSSSSHLSSSSPACYCSTLGCVSRPSLSLLCTQSLHSLKLMLHSQFTAGILNWTSPSNKASNLERNLQSKMVAMHVSNSKAVTLVSCTALLCM